MIHQGSAMVDFDDFLPISNSKPHKLQFIKQLHGIATKRNSEINCQKPFFMLLTVNYLGHENGYQTSKPILSKSASNHKLPSSHTKSELMILIVSMISYSKFLDELHVNMKPLKALFHNVVQFRWNDELETLFQQIKTSLKRFCSEFSRYKPSTLS